MGTRFAKVVTLAFVVLAIASSAYAQDANDEVIVYTNADLERLFGPAEPAPANMPDPYDGEGWEFVRAFLDEQYARIEANRSHELEQARVQNESDALAARREPRLIWSVGAYPGLGAGFPYLFPGFQPARITPPESLVPELNPLAEGAPGPQAAPAPRPPRVVRNSAQAAARRNGVTRPSTRRP